MSQQKYPKAYEAYQQAVYRDGRNPTFWCSIGVLYYQINQYRDALDAYSRAIRLNPNISEVWYDLGTLVSVTVHVIVPTLLTLRSTSLATTRPTTPWTLTAALLSSTLQMFTSRLDSLCSRVNQQMACLRQRHLTLKMFIRRLTNQELSVLLPALNGQVPPQTKRLLQDHHLQHSTPQVVTGTDDLLTSKPQASHLSSSIHMTVATALHRTCPLVNPVLRDTSPLDSHTKIFSVLHHHHTEACRHRQRCHTTHLISLILKHLLLPSSLSNIKHLSLLQAVLPTPTTVLSRHQVQ